MRVRGALVGVEDRRLGRRVVARGEPDAEPTCAEPGGPDRLQGRIAELHVGRTRAARIGAWVTRTTSGGPAPSVTTSPQVDAEGRRRSVARRRRRPTVVPATATPRGAPVIRTRPATVFVAGRRGPCALARVRHPDRIGGGGDRTDARLECHRYRVVDPAPHAPEDAVPCRRPRRRGVTAIPSGSTPASSAPARRSCRGRSSRMIPSSSHPDAVPARREIASAVTSPISASIRPVAGSSRSRDRPTTPPRPPSPSPRGGRH